MGAPAGVAPRPRPPALREIDGANHGRLDAPVVDRRPDPRPRDRRASVEQLAPYDALVAVEDGAVLIDILNSPPVAGSIYVAIASGMVFLTLVLEPRANRWANIVLPILYIISIAVSVIGEDWAYFYFLSIAESALLLLIIWYAWTWPRQEAM
jgi:hypothetical protein